MKIDYARYATEALGLSLNGVSNSVLLFHGQMGVTEFIRANLESADA